MATFGCGVFSTGCADTTPFFSAADDDEMFSGESFDEGTNKLFALSLRDIVLLAISTPNSYNNNSDS